MMSSAPPGDVRLYLRPVWFIDSPVGVDESEVMRLAGTLLWFQAVEARWVGPGISKRAVVPLRDVKDWVAALPDVHASRAQVLLARLSAPRPAMNISARTLRLDTPQVMGILNMTPDSFSDGGKHSGDADAAADAGFAMHVAGAGMIDVGGESTRPGAEPVWEGDEIARVVPVIERLAKADVIVSVDTRKASVMEAALAAGAGIVNDVSGLTHDPRAMDVVAASACLVALMHSPSPGEDPHGGRTAYAGQAGAWLTGVIFDWLEARIEACVAAGIDRARIIVDPGIGFGKALADDTAIINTLTLFHGLGVPLLFGASRKRIVGALSNEAKVSERLGGSLALAMTAFGAGAQIVRVHDVPETVQVARVWRGLRDAALVAVG
ncbi:dihydropteroate synthase [Sphingobium sp. CR28]|uniref:dihydropteroate synthase n=1 Tax=Sphingobium sp. CR28 TaxID=3400272 RepID=UPI003FF00A53